MTDDSTLSESGTPERSPDSDNFAGLARSTLDELLERHPEAATTLGDHRFDDRLTDLSPEALDDEQRWASGRLAELDALPLDELSPAERVDAQILSRTATDTKIVINLNRVTDTLTKVYIKVGVVGDETLSRLILDKIYAELK